MLKVRIFQIVSAISAENMINKFIQSKPNIEIVDIKVGGDGLSSCMTYVIMYKENSSN